MSDSVFSVFFGFCSVVAVVVLCVMGYAMFQFFPFVAEYFGVSIWVVIGGFFVLNLLFSK